MLHQGTLNGGLTVISLSYIVCSQANVVCGLHKPLVLYMSFKYFNNLELKDTVFVNRADTSQK